MLPTYRTSSVVIERALQAFSTVGLFNENEGWIGDGEKKGTCMLTRGGDWLIEEDIADVAGELFEKFLVKVGEDGGVGVGCGVGRAGGGGG